MNLKMHIDLNMQPVKLNQAADMIYQPKCFAILRMTSNWHVIFTHFSF